MDIYGILQEMETDEADESVLRNSFNDGYYSLIKDEDTRKIYSLLSNVMSLWLDIKDNKNPYKPKYVFENGTSFTINELTKQDKETLSSLDYNRLPEILNAQIHDVIWVKWHDYKAACIAADSFEKLYENTFDENNWINCCKYINRAIIIASCISDSERKNKYSDKIFNDVLVLDGQDKLFLSITLCEILIDQDAECDFIKLLEISDKLIDAETDNDNRRKTSYELKKKLLKKLGKNSDLNKVDIDYADKLVELADNTNNKTQNTWAQSENKYQQALIIYQNNKLQSKYDDTYKKLEIVQKHIAANMQIIQKSIDVTDYYKQIERTYNSLSINESLVRLTIELPFLSKEHSIKEINNSRNSLQNFISTAITDSQGRNIFYLPALDLNNKENVMLHAYHNANLSADIYGSILVQKVFSKINNRTDFSENVIDVLTKDNPIIPEYREDVIKYGLYLAVHEQIYEALHILIPQTEHIFRILAKDCGDSIYRFTRGGFQQAILLNNIFSADNLNKCFNEDILFTFDSLLQQKAGANIRNEICHGLMNPRESMTGSCYYFVGALMKLLSWYAPKVQDIIEDWIEEGKVKHK